MRYAWLTLAGLLALAASLPAQQQSAPADIQKRLDWHLRNWEEKMKSVQTLATQCTRTTIDRSLPSTDVYVGEARFMKPNLAMLYMQKKDKPQIYEKYICSGTYLYEYYPPSQVVRIHELPPEKDGAMADDNLFPFLKGMKAEDAKRRYDLQLLKEDDYYVYLQILPRSQTDKADFSKAWLVLNNKTYLPRQLKYEQPNKTTVQWDFTKVENGVRLNRTDFTSPKLERDWKFVRVPKENVVPRNDLPPRVARPNR